MAKDGIYNMRTRIHIHIYKLVVRVSVGGGAPEDGGVPGGPRAESLCEYIYMYVPRACVGRKDV